MSRKSPLLCRPLDRSRQSSGGGSGKKSETNIRAILRFDDDSTMHDETEELLSNE